MSLSLGCAQFGQSYGVTNEVKSLSYDQCFSILEMAKKWKINYLDTAHSYGDCHKILGEYGMNDFLVSSKFSIFEGGRVRKCISVLRELEFDLTTLRVSNFQKLMIHDAYQLRPSDIPAVNSIFTAILDLGFAEEVGFSLYSDEILRWQGSFEIANILQVPLNIFDNRFVSHLNKNTYKELNIKVDARSVFLQGILLVDSFADLPRYFKKFSELQSWYNWVRENDVDPVFACLSWARSQDILQDIVIGANSPAQLAHIFSYESLQPLSVPYFGEGPCSLVDPRRWCLSV